MPQVGKRLHNQRVYDKSRMIDSGIAISREPASGKCMHDRTAMPNVIAGAAEPNACGDHLPAEVVYSASWCWASANKIAIA